MEASLKKKTTSFAISMARWEAGKFYYFQIISISHYNIHHPLKK